MVRVDIVRRIVLEALCTMRSIDCIDRGDGVSFAVCVSFAAMMDVMAVMWLPVIAGEGVSDTQTEKGHSSCFVRQCFVRAFRPHRFGSLLFCSTQIRRRHGRIHSQEEATVWLGFRIKMLHQRRIGRRKDEECGSFSSCSRKIRVGLGARWICSADTAHLFGKGEMVTFPDSDDDDNFVNIVDCVEMYGN